MKKDINKIVLIKQLYNWCCNQDIAHDSFQLFLAAKWMQVKKTIHIKFQACMTQTWLSLPFDNHEVCHFI